MMEFLEFIGKDGGHFWGFIIVLSILLTGIYKIILAIRGIKSDDE